MTVAELENSLRGGCLDDVWLTGFFDSSESPARFHAVLSTLYLEVDSRLFELRAVGTTGTLRIECVPAVREELELDDDMTHAATSVRLLALKDPDGSNELVSLRLWGVEEQTDAVHCAAAQLELANGQLLFFDPTYHFGIRWGGAEQKQIWLTGWPGAAALTAQTLTLAST